MKNQLSVFYEHIVDAQSQTGLPLETVCEKVKGFGFDFVEIDAKRLFAESETILPMLERAGLGVNCIYYFFDFGAAGGSPEADRAAAQGVTVVMEDFDGDSAPFSTAAELLWFMQNVPGLRCGFDTGNFLYSEEDAAAVLPDFLPYISAVHCKDRGWAKNAGEPKITVGGRAMYPVAVGDGDLDMAGMVRTILDAGYTGVFAAEHFGSADQLRDMERSAQYLKNL